MHPNFKGLLKIIWTIPKYASNGRFIRSKFDIFGIDYDQLDQWLTWPGQAWEVNILAERRTFQLIRRSDRSFPNDEILGRVKEYKFKTAIW